MNEAVTTTATCKNCDSLLTEKFCPNCGQKGDVHRITTAHVVHEFVHAFTHADKGFVLLVRELVKRPGIVAREYLEGKRKKYFNPLSFLVITSAFCAFVAYQVGYFKAFQRTDIASKASHELTQRQEMMAFTINHGKLIGLLLIVPLITFLGWIFFRKPRYNFAEHFVLQSFVMGQANIMRVLIIIPLFLIFPSKVQMLDGVFHLLMLMIMVVAYRQFFRQNIFFTILKSLLVMILFIILFWVAIYIYIYLKRLIF